MELMYASTRDANEKVTASQAILKGLANDGTDKRIYCFRKYGYI